MSFLDVYTAQTFESICEVNLPSLQKGEELHTFNIGIGEAHSGHWALISSVIATELMALQDGEALIIRKG